MARNAKFGLNFEESQGHKYNHTNTEREQSWREINVRSAMSTAEPAFLATIPHLRHSKLRAARCELGAKIATIGK